jgi:TolB-like protein
MPSLIPGYEYDIFISYRQKDNKGDMWVSEFVEALKTELESTFKEEISVYFDINPHDGLLETHDVDESLKDKLKCLVFIPIISRTYCDPKSFAWEHEFKAFVEQASKDEFGLKVKLPNGNVTSRVLPVQIHDLKADDKTLVENVLEGFLRPIEFIYTEPGVNRPLTVNDSEEKNINKTNYRNQINKVANAIDEIITVIKQYRPQTEKKQEISEPAPVPKKNKKTPIIVSSVIALALIILGILFIPKFFKPSEEIEKSIAVLPFRNESTDQENSAFVNGLMEKTLNNLQLIKDLRVISRTSVEQYRDQTKSIPEIAKELGVNYIVEGSAQKYGNAFSLSVQLIEADKREDHLWGKSFEQEIKEVDDILKIQSEIAQAITNELKAFITPEEQQLIDKVPTTNLTAYDLHLQAQDFYYKYIFTNDRSYLDKVSQLAYISLELDPEFALAYYWIGMSSLSDRELWGYTRAFYLDTALFYFDKALELDPTLSDAYAYRGVYYFEKGRKEKAIDDLEKAITISPNNSVGYGWLGLIYYHYRDYINALINLRKAEKLERSDENLATIYYWHVPIYISVGDFQKTELYINKVKELGVMFSDMEKYLPTIQSKWEDVLAIDEKDPEALVALGRIQEAEDIIRSNVDFSEPYLNNAHRIGIVFWMNGKKEEAMRFFDMQIEFCNESIRNKDPYGTGDAAYDLAGVYATLSNKEEAYKWLREYEKLGFRDGMHEYIKVDPLFDNLRDDEEFKEIVKQANDKADEMRARIDEMEEKGML